LGLFVQREGTVLVKHLFSVAWLLIGVFFLQSCANFSSFKKVDPNCPSPSKYQLDQNGNLMLQNGITLKCQVKNYTSKMSCVGVTDSTSADGLTCSNGKGQAVFLFDENGVLKNSRIF
jgi:hypothetical protein